MTIQKTPLVTTRQAAAALGLDERTIEERLRLGHLKGEKHQILFKDKWFVYKSEVDALMSKLESRLFDDNRDRMAPPPKTEQLLEGALLHEDFDPLTNHTFIDAYREFSSRNQNFSPAPSGLAESHDFAQSHGVAESHDFAESHDEDDPVLRFRDGKNFAPADETAKTESAKAQFNLFAGENDVPACEVTSELLEAAALMLEEPVVDQNSEYHQTMRFVAQEFGGCLEQSFTLINDLRRELHEKDIQLHMLPDLQRRVEADQKITRAKEAELVAARKKISELEQQVATLSKSPWKRFFERLAGQS